VKLTLDQWIAISAVGGPMALAAIGYLVRIERLMTRLVRDTEEFRESHGELWKQHHALATEVNHHGVRIAVLETKLPD
jgi:hypothetical protein